MLCGLNKLNSLLQGKRSCVGENQLWVLRILGGSWVGSEGISYMPCILGNSLGSVRDLKADMSTMRRLKQQAARDATGLLE